MLRGEDIVSEPLSSQSPAHIYDSDDIDSYDFESLD